MWLKYPKRSPKEQCWCQAFEEKRHLFKDGYKNCFVKFWGEGKSAKSYERKSQLHYLPEPWPFLSTTPCWWLNRQDRAGQKRCHQDLHLPETVLHSCRLATAAAVLPSSYAAYSVLILDSGDHYHGRAQRRSLRGEQRSKQVCSSIRGYIPNT